MSDDARRKLLDTAAVLFRRQGYTATGVKQILTESGTVAGSLYHHFPDGKVGLAAAVIEEQGKGIERILRTVVSRAPTFEAALSGWITALEQSMDASGGLDGCPIAPIAVEAPLAGDPVRAAAKAAFDSWAAVLAERLESDGLPAGRAATIGLFALAAVEGALLLSRAGATTDPLKALRASGAFLVAPTTESAPERRSRLLPAGADEA